MFHVTLEENGENDYILDIPERRSKGLYKNVASSVPAERQLMILMGGEFCKFKEAMS